MVKAANVRLVGWEKIDAGLVTAIVRGEVPAVRSAVDAGAPAGGKVGGGVPTHEFPRPMMTTASVYPCFTRVKPPERRLADPSARRTSWPAPRKVQDRMLCSS